MGKAQNSKYYDKQFKLSKKYSDNYKNTKYYRMWVKVIEWIRIYTFKNIIELGCGTGQFANMLYDNGFTNYIGYDFSSVAINKAKKFCGMKFEIKDIFDVKISQSDLMICLETLEHIDDIKLLKSIPTGVNMIISVPNFDCSSHTHHFKNEKSVLDYYSKYIKINECDIFGQFFLFRGQRTEYIPPGANYDKKN